MTDWAGPQSRPQIDMHLTNGWRFDIERMFVYNWLDIYFDKEAEHDFVRAPGEDPQLLGGFHP
jgi:hypothetical protein